MYLNLFSKDIRVLIFSNTYMKIYYADIILSGGVVLLGYLFYMLLRSDRVLFYTPHVFKSIENIDMSRRNTYITILTNVYMLPFILWFILAMFAMDFDLTEMNEHMLMFTVLTLLVSFIVKLQTIYMGLNWWYTYISFVGVGIYYVLLGFREGVVERLGLVDIFGIPNTTGVNPEVYLLMALSLTFVFALSFSVTIHYFLSK